MVLCREGEVIRRIWICVIILLKIIRITKNGLVQGYPDGTFKGDRSLTRYEFDQIIYNARQKGTEVDSRLVNEFQKELQYFHIDTVAQDKDGNATIERVRVNK